MSSTRKIIVFWREIHARVRSVATEIGAAGLASRRAGVRAIIVSGAA